MFIEARAPRTSGYPSPFGLALLGLGFIWGVGLGFALGWRLEPLAETTGLRAARGFLGVFFGTAEGALTASLVTAISQRLAKPRRRRVFELAISVLVAILVSTGVFSLIKLARVGAPLGTADLWFLASSAAQVASEGTRVEKMLLALALLTPLMIFGLLSLVTATARRRGYGLFALELAALGAVAVLGVAAVAWRYPESVAAAARSIPELAAATRDRSPQTTGDYRADPELEAAIAPYLAPSAFGRLNVLVLMLESVPWKRLYGPEARPESTPRVEALARESVVFDRAYATSTHSDYAQTSILASLHPRKFEGHDYFHDLSYPRTLFWDPLVPLGWRSAVFSCQNESWGNMIAFLRTPNLQVLRHAPDWPEAEHRGDGSESKVFEETPIAAFFEWLDEEPGRPFAVYLNFQATHYPYVVPAGWPVPFEPSAIDFPTTFLSYPLDKIPVMENRFHNALAYVDESVGRVVDGLAARGLLDRTALLIVSDHGEAFYEHGLPTHGTTLLEEQVRTAMLLRLPGVAPARIEQPVSVLDAIPTIYRWMGLPRHGNFQGRDDVLEPGYSAAGRPLPMTIQGMTREDGLLLDGWKYLVNWDRRERALFHLAGDPGEHHNFAAERPEEVERLDAALRALLGRQLGYYRARGWEDGYYPPPLP